MIFEKISIVKSKFCNQIVISLSKSIFDILSNYDKKSIKKKNQKSKINTNVVQKNVDDESNSI